MEYQRKLAADLNVLHLSFFRGNSEHMQSEKNISDK